MKSKQPRSGTKAKTSAPRTKKSTSTARSSAAKAKSSPKATAKIKSPSRTKKAASSASSKVPRTSSRKPVKRPSLFRRLAIPVAVIFVVSGLVAIGANLHQLSMAAINPAPSTRADSFEPKLSTRVLAQGLNRPWDIAELPDRTILFTQRNGSINQIRGNEVKRTANISRANIKGEGGVMGIAVDPDYAKNNYIYVCFNTTKDGKHRVFVTRYVYRDSKIVSRRDIITDIPANASGRHSGCQVETGKAGRVWVATGDAGNERYPQDPKSLAGKILRVDRTGKGISGNMGGSFDSRIFNYGHRNNQGLYVFDKPTGDNFGFSTEHGSNVEDELNQLRKGNFGWAPGANYNEGVPMTDTRRFPDAVRASWNSGRSTIAISGLTRLQGSQWGSWNGAYVMGVLKGKQLRLVQLDSEGKIRWQKTIMQNQFGRIRAAVLAKDGSLLISTDNGNNDRIIRITARR